MPKWNVRIAVEHAGPRPTREQVDTLKYYLRRRQGKVSAGSNTITAAFNLTAPVDYVAPVAVQLFFYALSQAEIRARKITIHLVRRA